jgi:hypothetical protein
LEHLWLTTCYFWFGRMQTSLFIASVWPSESLVKMFKLYESPNFSNSNRAYENPTIYSGPTLTQLSSSTINSTHWKFVFRCQNCTSWTGFPPFVLYHLLSILSLTFLYRESPVGGIGTDYAVQGYGLCLTSTGTTTSTQCVVDPSNAGSVINQHTDCESDWYYWRL